MNKRYYIFSKLLSFVNDDYDVTDADMNNYSDEIEISGEDEFGNTIKVTVRLGVKKDGD